MPPEQDDKASTSNDSDIEQNEYDRRREQYWAKIIFCERKFNELKPILLKERMNQVRYFQVKGSGAQEIKNLNSHQSSFSFQYNEIFLKNHFYKDFKIFIKSRMHF
jgi:hypothetical protein